jgi:hypothetical protein
MDSARQWFVLVDGWSVRAKKIDSAYVVGCWLILILR